MIIYLLYKWYVNVYTAFFNPYNIGVVTVYLMLCAY